MTASCDGPTVNSGKGVSELMALNSNAKDGHAGTNRMQIELGIK